MMTLVSACGALASIRSEALGGRVVYFSVPISGTTGGLLPACSKIFADVRRRSAAIVEWGRCMGRIWGGE
ncbi:hypothetical protein B0T26DRAFT_709968 [Lasiosphaeria miniovina]|uniref:Uncharacterized protein n=1 Tax=Lasiosphaeria miniovina TaxID=1954250 RepID=A0AA40AKJ0_9PEZI|nr:uncharacterized protein B0T26DRAFT_709968 [Lasiosphaeria miniovina]KAK0717465.1 hypothetical protein B0T26DRAFT_709968 [Lasiosphaeria miniovina]